jgi:hypothetical protein
MAQPNPSAEVPFLALTALHRTDREGQESAKSGRLAKVQRKRQIGSIADLFRSAVAQLVADPMASQPWR